MPPPPPARALRRKGSGCLRSLEKSPFETTSFIALFRDAFACVWPWDRTHRQMQTIYTWLSSVTKRSLLHDVVIATLVSLGDLLS